MAAASYVEGAPAALQITQSNSQRFFQRPDATHLTFDPNRTSLSGLAFKSYVQRNSGYWAFTGAVDGRSPGFGVNDIGFLLDSDILRPSAEISYDNASVRNKRIRELFGVFKIESVTDFAPDLLRHVASATGQLRTTGLWTFTSIARLERQILDTKLLRGGPAVRGQDNVSGTLMVASPPTKTAQIGVTVQAWARPASGSWQASVGIPLKWNPRSNLELSLVPTFVRTINDSQYIGTVNDALDNPHYITGHLEQSTFVLTTRLEYTLSPNSSLQLYAQPFLSAGEFTRFHEAADVRSTSYRERFSRFDDSQISQDATQISIDSDGDGMPDLSFGRPDFQIGNLISNLVYRWEFLPGSQLFVIWSQSRKGADKDSDALTNVTTGGQSAHVLLFKLSYWWNI